jgi:hypothetical protein
MKEHAIATGLNIAVGAVTRPSGPRPTTCPWHRTGTSSSPLVELVETQVFGRLNRRTSLFTNIRPQKAQREEKP